MKCRDCLTQKNLAKKVEDAHTVLDSLVRKINERKDELSDINLRYTYLNNNLDTEMADKLTDHQARLKQFENEAKDRIAGLLNREQILRKDEEVVKCQEERLKKLDEKLSTRDTKIKEKESSLNKLNAKLTSRKESIDQESESLKSAIAVHQKKSEAISDEITKIHSQITKAKKKKKLKEHELAIKENELIKRELVVDEMRKQQAIEKEKISSQWAQIKSAKNFNQ